MSDKRPRFHVSKILGGWKVVERLPSGEYQAIYASTDKFLAEQFCQQLNRGIVESVAPDGRWTEEEGCIL